MPIFHHKDLGNHLLQLCPKVVKHPVYIIQLDPTLYFIRLYYFIIAATCFGPIVGPSSGWSLNRWSVQRVIFPIYEISQIGIINCTLHLSKDQPEDGPAIGPKHVAAIIN